MHTRSSSFISATLLAASALVACSPTAFEPEGELRMGLFGEGSSGQTYRLRDAVFLVDGPGGQTELSTETLPDQASALSAVLAEGDYTVDLQDGWHVERAGANATWQDVAATLASANPANATVVAQSTSTVTYTFSIDGEAVPFDQGTLEIDVEFEDTDAPCPDENNDGFCDACGDLEITAGEECDGSNLAGETCTSFGFALGTLSCDSSCTFDTSACTSCGDQQISSGEECDGANLGGESCTSLGFVSGTLSCDSSCTFDTSACSTCGDGVIDPGESCDPPGEVLDASTCGGFCVLLTTCNNACQIEQACEC